jgi:hypothetical protein
LVVYGGVVGPLCRAVRTLLSIARDFREHSGRGEARLGDDQGHRPAIFGFAPDCIMAECETLFDEGLLQQRFRHDGGRSSAEAQALWKRPPVRLTTGERAEPMRCRSGHVDAGSAR